MQIKMVTFLGCSVVLGWVSYFLARLLVASRYVFFLCNGIPFYFICVKKMVMFCCCCKERILEHYHLLGGGRARSQRFLTGFGSDQSIGTTCVEGSSEPLN